jgi:hypothetical protein
MNVALYDDPALVGAGELDAGTLRPNQLIVQVSYTACHHCAVLLIAQSPVDQ